MKFWSNYDTCPKCQGLVYYDGPGCWPPANWCEEEEEE